MRNHPFLRLTTVVLAALLIPVLAGCSSTSGGGPVETPTQSQPPQGGTGNTGNTGSQPPGS